MSETAEWLGHARSWVESMRVPDSACEYRLHAQAEGTVFSSCFALFFKCLVGETGAWNERTRNQWIDYLRGFQDEHTGLFRDPAAAGRATDAAHDADHLDRQLTGFCISALRALGAVPRYPIAAVEPWFDPAYMRHWLDNLNWRRASNSGNKAMFIAIMLIAEMERDSAAAGAGLDAWFEWHDTHADPATGYWGSAPAINYFVGMTGYVHQFLIYNYKSRRTMYPERVIDRTLHLQQADSLFSPTLGGAGCDDFDALHVLCHLYQTESYRRADIRAALEKALHALFPTQNRDGGFAWGRRWRFGVGDWSRVLGNAASRRDPLLLYVTTRAALAGQRHLHKKIETGWSSTGRGWEQSNLWDTWFRTLTIAEIETVLCPNAPTTEWKSLGAPNFGWFLCAGTRQ